VAPQAETLPPALATVLQQFGVKKDELRRPELAEPLLHLLIKKSNNPDYDYKEEDLLPVVEVIETIRKEKEGLQGTTEVTHGRQGEGQRGRKGGCEGNGLARDRELNLPCNERLKGHGTGAAGASLRRTSRRPQIHVGRFHYANAVALFPELSFLATLGRAAYSRLLLRAARARRSIPPPQGAPAPPPPPGPF